MNPIEIIIIFVALSGALLAGRNAAIEEIEHRKSEQDFIDYYHKAPLIRRDKNKDKEE